MRLNPLRLFLVILALVVASAARAQDPTSVTTVIVTPPPAAPTTFKITADLTARLNVALVAFTYNFSAKSYEGQGEIGAFYALTSSRLYDAGVIAGGSIAFDTKVTPKGEWDAGLVSPRIKLTDAVGLHVAVLAGRRFGGDDTSWVGHVAPSLSF